MEFSPNYCPGCKQFDTDIDESGAAMCWTPTDVLEYVSDPQES